MSTETGSLSPGRSPLDKHRFVVEGATFDEFDEREYGTDNNGADISLASTVDVDNTHPYLTRFADMYAHHDHDADLGGSGPTFVGVKPSSQFEEGERVIYSSSNGPSEAIVMKVVYDENRQPHYTIKLASGKEKQATSDRLDQSAAKGAMDEHGNVPTRCVSFKSNPTILFQFLYDGKWKDALRRLRSHPEEASIWVARYKKKGSVTATERGVRWQLLPLHLFIALAGRSNYSDSTQDAPHDEKDEIDALHEKAEESKVPPLELLAALLSAYPQATHCTDDKNMIPLHSAIRGNSSLAIIEKLVNSNPSSVYRKDLRGRNAFVLVEKVFGKRVNREQVGNEDKEKEMKCVNLVNLLSAAARRIASPEKAQPKGKEMIIQQKRDKVVRNQMQQLQNENLALRRDNAELRHRAEINDRLLRQLVEKLQMYEEQRSVEIENYNEIFGSKDELSERREGILLSISEEEDGDGDGMSKKEPEQSHEKRAVGGDGAYHKRLERYLYSTPTRTKGEGQVVSPASVTEVTEPETPCTPTVDSNIDENGTMPGAAEYIGEVVMEVSDGKRDGSDYSSDTTSEVEEVIKAKPERKDIFRPLQSDSKNDANTEITGQKTSELDTLKTGIISADADGAKKASKEDTIQSDPEIAAEATGVGTSVAKVPESMDNSNRKLDDNTADYKVTIPAITRVLSTEEQDQLEVE
ncbi:hypothetical protein ACHAWF_005981 [Thalassiosira exigua]